MTRLLREVALRLGDERLVRFCEDWLAERIPLVDSAETELAWFADVPGRALKSGWRAALTAR